MSNNMILLKRNVNLLLNVLLALNVAIELIVS